MPAHLPPKVKRTMPSNLPQRPPPPPRTFSKVRLIIGLGLVVIAGAVIAVTSYWEKHEHDSEIVTFRLCIGSDRTLCPADAAFVRNQGEDTLTRWAQRECPSYKRRRILVNEGPKDCNCTLADVTCSSE